MLTPQQQDLVLQAGSDTAVARRILDAAGIAYRFHSELGNPADRIVDLIRSQACDEVVVGSRGMSALDNLAFGSVAYKIVHLSPVPVTVVPNPSAHPNSDSKTAKELHRILLPVDGSKPAARAVDYVCALRDARVPVDVRLLNVQMPIASANVRRFVSQETIDAYCRAEGGVALGAAKKALQAAGMAFDEDIAVGHAGQIIARQALHWRMHADRDGNARPGRPGKRHGRLHRIAGHASVGNPGHAGEVKAANCISCIHAVSRLT